MQLIFSHLLQIYILLRLRPNIIRTENFSIVMLTIYVPNRDFYWNIDIDAKCVASNMRIWNFSHFISVKHIENQSRIVEAYVRWNARRWYDNEALQIDRIPQNSSMGVDKLPTHCFNFNFQNQEGWAICPFFFISINFLY